MIAYLSGRLLEKNESSAVIDTGGVGYEVFLPSSSRVFLKSSGDEVVLRTAQIFKEDDVSLYGFEDKASLRLFRLLITVSGVGAKAALAILSAMSADEAVRAIAFGDAQLLTRANGVGKKSAERIVMELKDKAMGVFSGSGGGGAQAPGAASGTGAPDAAADAMEALMALGYSRAEAAQALLKVQGEYATVEEGVRLALKNI